MTHTVGHVLPVMKTQPLADRAVVPALRALLPIRATRRWVTACRLDSQPGRRKATTPAVNPPDAEMATDPWPRTPTCGRVDHAIPASTAASARMRRCQQCQGDFVAPTAGGIPQDKPTDTKPGFKKESAGWITPCHVRQRKRAKAGCTSSCRRRRRWTTISKSLLPSS